MCLLHNRTSIRLNYHLLLLLHYDLISDRQYGFRKNRSTGDLLVYATHTWGEAIEKHGEALAVSLDISKAFDRVWHGGLLSKLSAYGIPAGLCSWISDFLRERSFRVVVDGHSSDLMAVNAGVPQGSVLSATLFLLHINDLLNPNLFGYADDSTVTERYLSSPRASANDILEHRESLVERINLTLKEVSDWGDANLVKFNAAKTQSCLFSAKKSPFTLAPTFRGVSVPISDHIELLGVNISSNLNFGKCIESKAKVAAKKLGILNKVRRYFTPGQRLALYQAQVRTSMEYCSHLWGGSAKYQLEALDSVDRRARRIIGD
ncbi:jg22219 [Pararge aegeria aegeria]|uniref:Jg22219 protein n=1 Tax=Pararge aegeria aegeria TaxID=348720 RepID=A0A8S4QTB0_9NEOP|nr:jg22219 [Pararge aegeria aegeria]